LLESKIIEEINLRDFFYKIATRNKYVSLKLSKRILNRRIYPLEIRRNGESICLIPITKKLNASQIELLNYKYPNGILITSMEDKQELQASDVNIVENLYEVIYKLVERSPKRAINELFTKVSSEHTSRLLSLSKKSAGRINKDKYYQDLGKIGPDFFEADINILFNYIFRNSIWLGANTKGRKLPDSISAFPLHKNKGCIMIDAKFTDKSNFEIGELSKNKVYVNWGKANKSIIKLGKLRGFIFVSNKQPQGSFKKNLATIIGPFWIMGASLNTKQLLNLYKLYRKHEDELNRNYHKRDTFLEYMERFFTKPSSYKAAEKIIVWENNQFNRILRECERKIQGSTRLSVN
jgi:hypothetical protein